MDPTMFSDRPFEIRAYFMAFLHVILFSFMNPWILFGVKHLSLSDIVVIGGTNRKTSPPSKNSGPHPSCRVCSWSYCLLSWMLDYIEKILSSRLTKYKNPCKINWKWVGESCHTDSNCCSIFRNIFSFFITIKAAYVHIHIWDCSWPPVSINHKLLGRLKIPVSDKIWNFFSISALT